MITFYQLTKKDHVQKILYQKNNNPNCTIVYDDNSLEFKNISDDLFHETEHKEEHIELGDESQLGFKYTGNLNGGQFCLENQHFDGLLLSWTKETKSEIKDFTLFDLLEKNMFDKNQLEILKGIAEKHQSVLIVGPVGSGKTTLMNAIAHNIADHEMKIIHEDHQELETLPLSVKVPNYDLLNSTIINHNFKWLLSDLRISRNECNIRILDKYVDSLILTINANSVYQAMYYLKTYYYLDYNSVRSVFDYTILLDKEPQNPFKREVIDINDFSIDF